MRQQESGFALLFVYAMAATIAIMLYLELPRVAFEAQRDKEQLLIDRGEQYSRAIALYVRKFNRYPADFEALENTQNLRFLRRRYVDPMTGKDEWRLIHVGPGGVFTDSLVYGKKKDGSASAPQNFITEFQQTGGNQAADGTQGVNLAGRLRPSDQPGAPGDPNNPQAALPQSPLPQPGQPNLIQPGLIQPGFAQPGLTQPGLPQFDANGALIPNTGQIQQPGFPGQQQPFPPGVQLPPGVSLPPGANQQPGQLQTIPVTGANLIGQLLTTPRPGGLNGTNGINAQQPSVDQYGAPIPGNTLAAGNTPAGFATPAAAIGTPLPPPGGQVIGGGIAGVASKREQEGIKIYGERTKYNEWEFVYDITKDKTRGAVALPQQAGAAGAQQQQQLQQMQQALQQAQQNLQQTQQAQQQAQQIQQQLQQALQQQQPPTAPQIPSQ